MSHPNQASIICKHTMQDFANAKYVTHQGQSWGAGCSKCCLEASGPATLSMVCLSCFSDIPGLPKDYYTLPSGFAYHRTEDGWYIDYDIDEFEPEEGEFIAAPEEHTARHLYPDETVYALVLPDGSYAVLNLVEGTRCVAFWLENKLPEDMQRLLDGSEQFMAVIYSKLQVFARESNIRFLAPDFLVHPYDVALLVPDNSN